uniref:T-complex protein 11-like protein 1 n=1 Tax=Crassostrea virginica TaxID=6565 RepID=A0A8B8AKQ5_CRAVI|nr:T-complex protein 11-like protein 1 [Crassostrea virginica]XP_022291173.1 T-complex protein 11-like protein 1 [Crassostrea virginica]
MSGKDNPDSLDNSLNGEFPLQDKDDELNMSTSSSISDSEEKEKKVRTESPSSPRIPPAFMVAASPPKFLSFEQLMEAANGVKNMALAHEIAVNTDFKLESFQPPDDSIEKKVKDTVRRAFWDAFQAKLDEDPPDFSHALVLIEEVKENIMMLLLPQHVRFRAQITEVLDIDLIRQKLENDAFDIYYYSNYIIGVMEKLCAPVRDEQVAKLKTIKEIVPLFKAIFEVLDLMKMDMANFTIQQIRPYCQQQSVEYERKKFLDFLKSQQEAGIDGLEFTKAWLKRSHDKITDVNAVEEAMALPLATPAAIMNEAYIELLNWDDKNVIPETLVMDHARLLEQREAAHRLALISSVLMVTYGSVGASISGVQSLKDKMKSEICTLLEGVPESDLSNVMSNVGEHVNKLVNEFLSSHGFQARDETQQKLLVGQIKEMQSKDNRVYKLLLKRLLDFLRQIISSQHKEPLKVPPGFSAVESELSQLCGKFLRLISYNRSVFGSFYTDIINTLLKKHMADLSPR